MVSLVDDGKLKLTFQDLRDPMRRRFRFTFKTYPAYRNILEEFRTSEEGYNTKSWTVIVEESQWLERFRKQEPIFDAHYPEIRHYLFCTEDDVIEVLSPEPPEIEEIAPADENEELPGKSNVYYFSEDFDSVEDVTDFVLKKIESGKTQKDA